MPQEPEAVLVGAGVLGAVASGNYSSILVAMEVFNKAGNIIQPDFSTKEYHAAKYKIFLKMYQDQQDYKETMKDWSTI